MPERFVCVLHRMHHAMIHRDHCAGAHRPRGSESWIGNSTSRALEWSDLVKRGAAFGVPVPIRVFVDRREALSWAALRRIPADELMVTVVPTGGGLSELGSPAVPITPPTRRLTPRQAEAAEAYRRLGTVDAVARELNTGTSNVRGLLSKAGVITTTPGASRRQAAQMLQEGASPQEIVAALGISLNTVALAERDIQKEEAAAAIVQNALGPGIREGDD